MTPDNPRFYRYVVLAAEDMAKSLRTAHDYETALKIAGKPECVFQRAHVDDAMEEFRALASELGFTLTPIQPEAPVHAEDVAP